jgi:hypothetical protein
MRRHHDMARHRRVSTKGLSMSAIESVLQERRIFPPSAEATADAAISGMDAYKALTPKPNAITKASGRGSRARR